MRLRDAGYERHEILHMLARPVSEQIWGAPHDERPYDHITWPRSKRSPAPRSGSVRQDLGKAPRRRPAVDCRKATAGGDQVAPLAP